MDASKKKSDLPLKKRRYKVPVLQVFGKISVLTQNTGSGCVSDNGACVPVAGGNMGPMAMM